jgi:hypothetical protein
MFSAEIDVGFVPEADMFHSVTQTISAAPGPWS